MKIVHVIDYFQPKLGYQETFLAREHAKMGHEVFVVTSDRYNPIVYLGDAAKPILGERIVAPGFFIEEDIKVWRLKTLFEVPHGIWIVGLEKKILELEPDLLIVHGIANYCAVKIAFLKRRLPFCKLIFDDHMTFDNSTSIMRVFYPLFKLSFAKEIKRAGDAFVAIAPASIEFMHEKYGISYNDITLIPLGADDDLFRFDSISRQKIRDKLSLQESCVLFIYTGKIIPEKNLHLLVKAAKLLEKYTTFRILLVGNGSLKYIQVLKDSIRVANLDKLFFWHDAVPNSELYMYYSAADVAIWPRGASISQREAMACGLPLIVSDGSPVTDLVSHENGFILHEDDPSHLAEQMEKLLDPYLRKIMGINSRKAVENELSWKVIAKQFTALVAR